MLTPDQIRIVKRSWATYRDIDPALLGEVFYRKLFLEYPSMRVLFSSPLEEQYKKLVEMLNIMVARLDRPHEIITLLEQLGVRHRQYGVRAEHYTPIGQVLLWTLKAGLGDRWSFEMEIAWTTLYEQVTTVMLRAH